MSNKASKALSATPGPWNFTTNYKGEVRMIGNSMLIFEPCRMEQANAHLIAAAPTMLNALEFVLCHYDDPEAWPEILDKVREAINDAKTTGQA